MLFLLHIENIAVIEQADIEFGSGFNALTGETGAGKSIVIDSLGAVIGQRASRELVRTGAEKAVVSAMFTDCKKIAAELDELGVAPDEDGNIMLQRNIQSDGKNICRINGNPVTVAQLRTVGAKLLNIHGQHDGQQLLDEATHLTYLDSFGRTESTKAAYVEAYEAMIKTKHEIGKIQTDASEKERRVDSLNRQIEELTKAKLKDGEEEELLIRRNLLRNSEKFISAIEGADYNLNGGDDNIGVTSMLMEAERSIASLSDMGDEFPALAERINQARIEIYDIAETIRDMKDGYNFSPEELDSVEGRLDKLSKLERKYGDTVSDMLEYLEKAKAELNEIEYSDDILVRLNDKLEKQKGLTLAAAEKLTEVRKRAAKNLEERILSELRDLDMKNVRFTINFAAKEPDKSGADSVKYLMSANAGEELRPINKIASGGELARIMLALKNVLAESDNVGTLVFDEVDTGVSGRAAEKVAEKMAEIASGKQVLCVTHLPQIAAMADTHFSVEKRDVKGRTFTELFSLNREKRREELARLTGGTHITPTMLSAAEELLAASDKFKTEHR